MKFLGPGLVSLGLFLSSLRIIQLLCGRMDKSEKDEVTFSKVEIAHLKQPESRSDESSLEAESVKTKTRKFTMNYSTIYVDSV